MKSILSLLCCLFALASQLHAQIEVGVKSIRRDYVIGENVLMKIILRNITDQAITLDNTPNRSWLHFTVTSQDRPNGVRGLARPVFPKITIPAGKTVAYNFNLRPYFAFDRAGNYRVQATVRRAKEVGNFTSVAARFALASGASIRKFNIVHKGVPIEYNARLMLVNGKNCIFGQATNTNTHKVLSACFMGEYLNFMKPIFKLDSAQNLHVLCQSTPKIFTHAAMNSQGKRVSYQLYKRTGGPINLVSSGGKVRVVGASPVKNEASVSEPEDSANVLPI